MKIKTKDGFLLDAVFNKIEGSKKGIIFAHGITVDKNDEGMFNRSEPKLKEQGFSTIRFDFRAHGKSTGNSATDFNISGELIDLETIVQFLKDNGITEIHLAGASFGGGICSLYAGKHFDQINTMLLVNPVLDFEKTFLRPTTAWAKKYFQNRLSKIEIDGIAEIGSRNYKVGKKFYKELTTYKPYKELTKYNSPILVIHGDKDTKVSCHATVETVKSLSNRKIRFEIIKGSEHGFHKEPYETQVVDLIVGFYGK
jgi:uncharacterized protein